MGFVQTSQLCSSFPLEWHNSMLHRQLERCQCWTNHTHTHTHTHTNATAVQEEGTNHEGNDILTPICPPAMRPTAWEVGTHRHTAHTASPSRPGSERHVRLRVAGVGKSTAPGHRYRIALQQREWHWQNEARMASGVPDSLRADRPRRSLSGSAALLPARPASPRLPRPLPLDHAADPIYFSHFSQPIGVGPLRHCLVPLSYLGAGGTWCWTPREKLFALNLGYQLGVDRIPPQGCCRCGAGAAASRAALRPCGGAPLLWFDAAQASGGAPGPALSQALAAAAGSNCTLLVHEATFEDDEGGARHALERGHATAGEALDVARRMRARHTILTHFSARCECSSPPSPWPPAAPSRTPPLDRPPPSLLLYPPPPLQTPRCPCCGSRTAQGASLWRTTC